MSYSVRTPVFEGPFDLLLHLILKQEVELWEVSLAEIVDAYLTELDRMDALDLDVATEFLLIAATLVELKARRLLPGIEDLELDEELLRFEERDLLLARLLECKTFKDAAGAMQRLMDATARSWPRISGPHSDSRFADLAPDLLAGVTAEQLRDAMDALLEPKPAAQVLLDHVAPVRISVRDAVAELIEELPRRGRSTFSELTTRLAERLEIIVHFLALLELYKQGLVDLEQAGSFAELHVLWLGGPGPGEPAEVEEYQG